jgi:ATP-binding cassette, subfamily B, bacterial
MPKPSTQRQRSRRAAKLRQKLANLGAQFALLPQTLTLIWAASRGWTVAWLLLLVLQGVLPAATVYLTRWVVDSLVGAVGNGISAGAVQTLLLPVGLMVGILLLTELLQSGSELVRTAQAELVKDHVNNLIHRQATTLDYEYYELSEFGDRIERAQEGADERSLALLESLGSLLQSGVTLVLMAAILLPYGLWLPAILCFSALPAFYVALRTNRTQYHWSQRTTTDRRWLSYYNMLIASRWSAAEVRLFDLGDQFRLVFQTLRRRLRGEQIRLVKVQSFNRLLAGLSALVISSLALVWMGYKVMLGAVTLGDMALFYQAFSQGQGLIRTVLGNLGQIYKNSLFIGNLFEFLNLRPRLFIPEQFTPTPAVLKRGIQFDRVTFRYPGVSQPILENFSLDIPAGKIVAIVGDNGAGKSTLIKLLCRFYDPEAGQIVADGTDIKYFAVQQWRRMVTVLFQEPLQYCTTAVENIAFGDMAAPVNLERVEAAAHDAGIHDKLSQLPESYDTILGRWFPGGVDLSGGQWQRLALARAFYRQAPFIVLDEPTSAMDPWAEFDWLERFRRMAQNRTALVITHRFTLAMRADMIHVMRAGKIVESGSHDELLALDGLYAQSWRSQMQAPTPPSELNGHSSARR